MSLLDIAGVSIAFGGVRAVREVSFGVEAGEIVGLIGPNGAGKTTLLRLLFGLARPDSGRIRFAGHEIAGLPTHRRARLGMGFTHQIVRPFRDMSLLDNVVVAAAPEVTGSPLRALVRRDARHAVERARALLARLDIADAAERPARTVPLGYLKRLQVARALALGPRFLMLDEPLAGLNHSEAARLADVIVALNRDGITVLIVEHNIAEVMRISQRLVVLHNGSVLADGPPAEVMQRGDVREAYLGTHA